MNCVRHAHILTLPRRSFARAAMVAYAYAPVGQRAATVDSACGYGNPMSRDARRTGPTGLQGYTQHMFIGVEDNQ